MPTARRKSTDPPSRPRPRKPARPVTTLLGVVLVVAIVYLAKPVLLPLSLAVLFSFILSPLVTVVQRWVRRRVPAVLIVVLAAMVVVVTTSWVVGLQVGKLAQDLPTHTDQVRRKVQALQSHGGIVAKLYQMVQEVGQSSPTTRPTSQPGIAAASPMDDGRTAVGTPKGGSDVTARLAESVPPPPTATAPVVTATEPQGQVGRLVDYATVLLEPIADAGLILILVIYFLIRREDTRNRLIGLLGHTRLAGTTRVTVETAQRVGKLLLAQLCVNVSFGLIFGLLLLVIGVPYAFLWAFVTAVLRFVPYVGTWIAAAGPILLSFAMSPGWGQPIAVFATFLVLDTVTANVIEPLLFGHSTGVSPVALLVAAVFWTWIWGPVGLVLSTPITICLVVMGQHVPKLRVLWLLLGDRPPLAPSVVFYQRLLAGDQVEAAEVVAERAAVAGGRQAVYDEVLVPALRMIRREREFGGLAAADEKLILDAAQQIVDGLPGGSPVAGSTPAGAGGGGSRVLAIPAHHRAEELTLHMLGRALGDGDCTVDVVTTKVLPAEIEARIERDQPDLVLIAVMPPGGLIQARYLCRRLGRRFAGLRIVVGYWGKPRDFDRLLVRLRSAGASYVTTSIAQTRSQTLALVGNAVAA